MERHQKFICLSLSSRDLWLAMLRSYSGLTCTCSCLCFLTWALTWWCWCRSILWFLPFPGDMNVMDMHMDRALIDNHAEGSSSSFFSLVLFLFKILVQESWVSVLLVLFPWRKEKRWCFQCRTCLLFDLFISSCYSSNSISSFSWVRFFASESKWDGHQKDVFQSSTLSLTLLLMLDSGCFGWSLRSLSSLFPSTGSRPLILKPLVHLSSTTV